MWFKWMACSISKYEPPQWYDTKKERNGKQQSAK